MCNYYYIPHSLYHHKQKLQIILGGVFCTPGDPSRTGSPGAMTLQYYKECPISTSPKIQRLNTKNASHHVLNDKNSRTQTGKPTPYNHGNGIINRLLFE